MDYRIEPKNKRHHRHHDGQERYHRRDETKMMRGRKFSADEVQILLLHFLLEKANYGYELIKLFTQYSNGFYTPSPSVIYPALTYLAEIDYVTIEVDGNRKLYQITETGIAFYNNNQNTINQLISKLEQFAKRMDSIHDALARDDNEYPMLPELIDVRHQLRHIIHTCRVKDLNEQKRVADILIQAIQKILVD